MTALILHGLSVEQARELADHLRTALPADRLVHAVAAIDMACWSAHVEMTDGRTLRHGADCDRDHFAGVAAAADEVRTLLAVDRPLIGTAGLDWSQVDQVLIRIAESARAEVEARPARKRHRPSLAWRDRLISVIWSVYAGTATKTRGGHFEATVELALGYLERDVEDVHAVVIAALRRCPEPPYVVSVKDGITLP